MSASPPLLDVRDLRVGFRRPGVPAMAVDGVSLSLAAGRTLGLVGESGCGKTTLALAIMGLLDPREADVEGEVRLDGTDMLGLDREAMRRRRGEDIAIVFQQPRSSLHPLHRVGDQIAEAVRAHRNVGRRAALARAVDLLEMVGMPDPRAAADAFPHQLSGGMSQRAMIAMALVNQPRVLIADEPTTALDVTVQAQVLALLARLREELGMALLLITHDLGVVAQSADDVAVMYAGRIVERAPAPALFTDPEHPYTWSLLGSVPRLDRPRGARLPPIPGSPPDPAAPPPGCRFHPRCPHVREHHRRVEPRLEEVPDSPEHEVACLLDVGTRRDLWRAMQEASAARPRAAV